MRKPPAQPADDLATIQRHGPDLTTIPHAAFCLTVVEGPDSGQQFVLDGTQSSVLVGQGPACEIRLSDREVSRRHCCIESVGRRLRVADQGSTNGTFVDGVAVVEAFLRGGEIVRLGSTALRVEPIERNTKGQTIPMATGFGSVVGASLEMRRLYPLCARLAAASVPVVIEGETGTGKEVLAESLHANSPRSQGPFVVFDCTSVPPTLVESELFGHERGAFTGAVATRKGLFEEANGGTLLIDEIGDLQGSLQPKLLRAIERAEIRRVGSNHNVRVDVRVLAATRRDLDQEVIAGRFRDDLYHRLAVARIALPPLRRRRGDIALLVTHFCRELGGDPKAIPAELMAQWNDSPWPGNVRELRNAVARFLAVGELEALGLLEADAARPRSVHAPRDAADLFERVLAAGLGLVEARHLIVQEFEQRYLQYMLEQHGGNVSRAAAASGVARRYFQILKGRAARKSEDL